MPGVADFDRFTKQFGLAVGFLVAAIFALCYVIRVLYAQNQALHAKLTELLDQRGKFLDSILQEAISGKTANRRS